MIIIFVILLSNFKVINWTSIYKNLEIWRGA